MSRTFTVATNFEVADLLGRAKNTALEHGATLTGDCYNGRLSASGVEGEYVVVGGFKDRGAKVEITITKKPFYVPWGTVEKKVMEFFRT